ncbi:MAG: hypothetical protein ACREM6_02780 [Vulcanimicrobiaceae bacterium]
MTGVRPSRRRFGSAVGVGVLGAVIAAAASLGRATIYDNYTLLADAWRHGRLWIDWPGPYIDAVPWHGHWYVVEAPLPALLLLPAVLVAGVQANQTLLAALLGGVALGAGWQLMRNLGVEFAARWWLAAFLFAGTSLLWAAALGDVWFVAHVAAMAFSLLALCELTGRRRGWLAGLLAAAAIESRFPLALACIAYLGFLWDPADGRASVRRIAAFAGTLAAVALAHVGYDEARFGTLGDVGFTLFATELVKRTDPMFGANNLPAQLRAFFFALPNFDLGAWAWPKSNMFGLPLIWTSPALALALFARRPAKVVCLLWLAAILVAIPEFLYYDTGGAQFGMRHALDFEPFLFGLMALAGTGRLALIWKLLIAYSVAVGLYAIVYWQAFIR